MYTFLGKINQFYKFNANCKDSEKDGTGPGSCGGKKESEYIPPTIRFKNYRYVVKYRGKNNEELIKEFKSESQAKDFVNKYKPESTKSTKTSVSDKEVTSTKKSYKEVTSTKKSYKYYGTNEEISSTISKFSNLTIIHPNGYNLPVDENGVHDIFESLPTVLKSTIKQIEISPKLNTQKFVGGSAAGLMHNGTITTYGDFGSERELTQLLVHESAHALDKRISLSRKPEWLQAIKNDKNYPKVGMGVAQDNRIKQYPSEDLAESISLYLKDTSRFSKLHPNRYKVLKSILK